MNLKPPAPALIRCTVGSLDGVDCDGAFDAVGVGCGSTDDMPPTIDVSVLRYCATAGETSS